MSLRIEADCVRGHLRPLVTVIDAPVLAGFPVDGLELSFDHFSGSSAGQLDNGIEYRMLHGQRALATFHECRRITGCSTFRPVSVDVFNIGCAVSVYGGLFADYVIRRPRSVDVFVVIGAANFGPRRGVYQVRDVLRGALDGPTFGLTDGGLAALQCHRSGFRLKSEKDQRQDQDDGRDGQKGLHDWGTPRAG